MLQRKLYSRILRSIAKSHTAFCILSLLVDVVPVDGTRTMFRNIVGIISGGASGLGGATASYLVRHGARVVVADLPAAEESFQKLDAFSSSTSDDVYGSFKFAKTDVTSEEDVSFALDMAENEFGEQGEWSRYPTEIAIEHYDMHILCS